MLTTIKHEIDALRERDPAARSALEVALLYPGFHAIMLHRPAHWLYKQKAFFPARMISQFSRFLTGIEIHPGAKIGRGVLIDHGSGVVIGETAVVGDGCTLYQGVTLGGTGKETGKRHPTLGKNVTVGSGAKILGPFNIGDNVKVASNAVVLKPAPANSTLVGMPARVVRINGVKVREPLDHVHIPDPVAQEMKAISREIRELKRKLEELEGKRK